MALRIINPQVRSVYESAPTASFQIHKLACHPYKPAMKTTWKMIMWLVAAVLLVALLAGSSFWTFSQAVNAAQTREHTHLVLNKSDNLLSAITDAETGQRGYLLTGDEAFLAPYVMVQKNIQGQLSELRQINTVAAAKTHLDALEPLVDAKLSILTRTIELQHRHDASAAIALLKDGEGKRLMDSIRAEMRQPACATCSV